LAEIPQKLFYKIGEVCQYTDTQPYVLRFWESEFPALATEKNRNGQRVYRRQDIDLILRIKRLLYEEEYTIAEARKRLEQDVLEAFEAPDGKRKGVTAPGRKSSAKPAKASAPQAKGREEKATARRSAPEPPVAREEEVAIPIREPAAVESLTHRLEETTALLARTREALHAEEQRREECERRATDVAERLESLLERIQSRSS
jgi:DNA-binding transcriptional MerR regulator